MRVLSPLLKNTGSTARDHLASERTFLAWARTGLGFIALGIAVERFSRLDLEGTVDKLRDTVDSSNPAAPHGSATSSVPTRKAPVNTHASEHALTALLLGAGTGSLVYGTARYFSNMRYIEQGMFKPAYHGVGVLSVCVAGMAGLAYWGTVARAALEEERERRKGIDKRRH